MTFQELVSQKSKWGGGILETREGGYEGYNEEITDITVKDGNFCVQLLSGGECAVNMEWSHLKEINSMIVSFSIPAIGNAYMYCKKK